jgi:hypothetical protein
MKRTLVLIAALAFGLVLVGVTASAVDAQLDPVPVVPQVCEGEQYDLDGNGKVNSDDAEYWVRTVHFSGLCELDGPVGTCPPNLDLNGDGFITHADLDEVLGFLIRCVFPPRVRADPGTP